MAARVRIVFASERLWRISRDGIICVARFAVPQDSCAALVFACPRACLCVYTRCDVFALWLDRFFGGPFCFWQPHAVETASRRPISAAAPFSCDADTRFVCGAVERSCVCEVFSGAQTRGTFSHGAGK